jgi:hypothetical protein
VPAETRSPVGRRDAWWPPGRGVQLVNTEGIPGGYTAGGTLFKAFCLIGARHAADLLYRDGVYRPCRQARYASPPNSAMCCFNDGSLPYIKCLLISGEYLDRYGSRPSASATAR